MSELECPFCHQSPKVLGKMAWCINPRCWIRKLKIPRKVWESLKPEVEVSQISLGTCITCNHKNCFGRINTGDGYQSVDFCSLHDSDPDLELDNPMNSILLENWKVITLPRKWIEKMPLGWRVLFNRLVQFALTHKDPEVTPIDVQ